MDRPNLLIHLSHRYCLKFDNRLFGSGSGISVGTPFSLFDAKTEQLLYIGETQNFGQRMKSHAQKNWRGRAPVVSCHRLPDDVVKVHLHELENDLIAGYYEAAGDAPELQFASGG